MGRYRSELKQSAVRELYTVPPKELAHILEKIDSLSDTSRPRGCVKLTGREWYRIRYGDWRILYLVDDSTLVVYIVKIGRRDVVYR